MNSLVTGGARSGKSRYAQRLGQESGKRVLFVATAIAGDEEMRQRIDQHKGERPAGWRTLEAARDVGRCILDTIGDAELVIVDCITLLVSNVVLDNAAETGDTADSALAEREVVREIEELRSSMERSGVEFVIVTNEVGLGIVPANQVSRLFRDLLGKANQMLAETVDEVLMMVAGLPVVVKPARPHRA